MQYRYDPTGRLLAAVPEKARSEVFRYDPTGNIFDADPSVQFEYGPGNRLVRRGTTTYSYDDDGRLVERREDGANGTQVSKYGWNGQGLLSWVETPAGKRVEFSYDPFARRMEKHVKVRQDGHWVPETTTRFVWDADWLAHEIRGDGRTTTFVFYDTSRAPLAQNSGDGWRHFVNDTAGAPRRLLDDRGVVVGEVELSVWGAPSANALRQPTPIRFQGQYADDETGLHYNRFRYYDPDTSRFLSPDPMGPAAGMNQYRYAPNPLSCIDPLGLWAPGNPGPSSTNDPTYVPDPTNPNAPQSRVSSVTATIRPVDLGTGTGTNASSRAAARALGCSTDDAGHPIANRLGGEGGVGNVFPQDPHVNRGAFRVAEKSLAEQVQATGQTAQVNVTYEYPDAHSTRPSGVVYTTTIGGATTTQRFPN